MNSWITVADTANAPIPPWRIDQGRRQHPFHRQRIPRSWGSIGNGIGLCIGSETIAGDAAYKATHDTLLTFNGDINEKTLRRLATILGHDDQAVLDKMNQESVMKEIAETRLLAARLQINGTPTFVFDDELVRGAVS